MALLSGSGQPASPRESAGAAVAPGLLTRVAQGLRWAVGGRAPTGSAPAETAAESGHDDWFGPSAPLAPVAQDQAVGRQFDYPVGYNLTIRPRQADPIGFDQLRGLADSYDLLRLVIETRKDQIARLDWCFRPRGGAPVVPGDPRIARLTEFFANPDREHGWDGWLRMLVEDMLVIDAATLYPRRDQGGALYALEPVDGATIKRVLDDRGRTPLPPDPAYQQVLKGLPAVDYTRDELLYLPRNPRSWRVYGFSPVEQVVMTVNIALRRQLHQLEYYTEGSVPEALIGVPETWTPDQIGQFQAYWDALLEGDTAQRRHARFVPATISKSFVQTKDAALKDEYDEWLARIICYAFAVAPGSLTRDNNRATADFQHSQALQEGLLPLMRWVKALVDRSIADHFGWPDLEFAWKQDRDIDPLTQAQINQIYLAAGVLTPDEVRAEIGKGDAAAKRQAGGVVAKDWRTQGRQGEGAKNPAWFGNGTGGGVILVAGERPSGGGGGRVPPRLGVRPFTPAETGRREDYAEAQRSLAEIDPHNRFATSIERDDWVPEQRDIDEVWREYDRQVDEVASRIASGHAYGKHADGVPECYNREHFESMVNEAIRNPDYVRPRPGGGVYLYNRRLDMIVIIDPSSADNGTAFRREGGATGARSYIDDRAK